MNIQKCAIIGCGGVGATAAFTLTQSSLFNEIVLIDANHKKAEGEALDISHGLPFTRPINIYAGDYQNLKDAYLVIITAGASQSPGETRLDIASKNISIFKKIIPEIIKYNQDCILLVVTNPVDILTTFTLKMSGFPAKKIIGSGTVLDTARLKYLLGKRLKVDNRNIHAFIIGEHGDSELAVWSSAKVCGLPIEKYCQELNFCEPLDLNEIYKEVRNSAYEIIDKKGATYYAVALVIRRIAEALVRDEHSILSVSNFTGGQYGIKDICIGLPAVVGRNGIENLIEISLNNEENSRLLQSAEKLKSMLDDITN